MKRVGLILAGGAGTRLWPLSSVENPKQFLRIFDGMSLLQKTWGRLARLLSPDSIFLSTNERYREKCLEQLPALSPENLIAEPVRRNTAPAIALSCFAIESRFGEPVAMAALPSDHSITEEAAFLSVLSRAYDFASTNEFLVTIGIQPTEPSPGYGYLELGDEVVPGVIRLRRFVEKPSRERAVEFLRAGNYAWNGGIFLWRSDVFRHQLTAVAPEIARVAAENYEAMPSISIDYALMEKAPNVATLRGDFGWSDVGSWAAVARLTERGSAELIAEEASNVFAHSESGRRIIDIGISNVAIVESTEGILVIDLEKAELLSQVVEKLT